MYRWCKKCKQLKPPRTHHCSVCGKCILKMDHHCPWVGSCVGFNNHKFFLQFLVYTTVGCLYSFLTMGIFTINNYDSRRFHNRETLIMASALSGGLTIAIMILLITHLYFVFSSNSSVESGGLMDLNPFFEPMTPISYEEYMTQTCMQKVTYISRKNFF